MAAGNGPLRVPLAELQAVLDAPRETVDANGKAVPTVASGLVDSERALLESRGLLNAQGKITPSILSKEALDTPEKLLSQERWDAIYSVPKGDVTIEHIQHAFYMAANYGFQILNGNFAAAIDDYELKQRFMNDLATYRIDVSWLWTLVCPSGGHHQGWIFPAVGAHRRRRGAGAEHRAGQGGNPLHPRAVPEGVGLSQRMDRGVLRRTGPARRSGTL